MVVFCLRPLDLVGDDPEHMANLKRNIGLMLICVHLCFLRRPRTLHSHNRPKSLLLPDRLVGGTGHRFLWPVLRAAETRQPCGLLPFNPAQPEAPLSRDRQGAVLETPKRAAA
jgi:hypothetical protein